jgi:hypothetical protein
VTSVRSYDTRFPDDENPLSEGGAWLNGATVGIDWTDVIAENGVVFGAVSRMGVPERRAEQGNLEPADGGDAAPEGDYDDPTAILGGDWGTDQHARAVVFSRNQTETYFQEVQIRLRSTMAPHSCSGYEVIFRCLKTENAYVEVVRWNGAVGDWTSLARHVGAEFGVANGDVVEASIVGHTIRASINGNEVITAVDDTYRAGGPGVGFNFGVADTNVDHGFSEFRVDTFDSAD